MRTAPIKVRSPARNWEDAKLQLERARHKVLSMIFTGTCLYTLSALGVSHERVLEAARAAEFRNPLVSYELRASLYANTPLAAAAMAQFGNQTIWQWFRQDDSVMAAADLNGRRIFVRPSGVDADSLLFNAALLLHELLHNVGLDDDTIKSRLGIGSHLTSEWVTSRIYDDCF